MKDWRRAVIVPLYRSKEYKRNSRNYWEISLLSIVVKIYVAILVE